MRIKRMIALMLAMAVALPWAALPAGAGSPCGPSANDSMASCSACRSGGELPESSLRPGCCRFAPRGEAAPIQASSVSPTPKPQHSPETPAAAIASVSVDRARAFGASIVHISPPPQSHAPPTETTRLLI